MRRSVILVAILSMMLFSSFSVAADDGPWSFIIVGDSRGSILTPKGFNVPIMTELANEIVRQEVDFIAFPGDLVLGGGSRKLERELLAWRTVMEPVYDAGIGVYPVRGNHDIGDKNGADVWRKVFSGHYGLPQNGPAGEEGLTYAVEHKNVLLVGLDQYVKPRRVNHEWLDKQLEKSDKLHRFVFAHEPAFRVKHTGCMDNYPEERDAFWDTLKRGGVRVYACAHDHFLDHSIVHDRDGSPHNGIHQYVVATAGAPLKKWSPPYSGTNNGKIVTQQHHHRAFGYVLVEVLSDTDYRLTWYARDKSGRYIPSEKTNHITTRLAVAQQISE